MAPPLGFTTNSKHEMRPLIKCESLDYIWGDQMVEVSIEKMDDNNPYQGLDVDHCMKHDLMTNKPSR